jgi:hypothetical protein
MSRLAILLLTLALQACSIADPGDPSTFRIQLGGNGTRRGPDEGGIIHLNNSPDDPRGMAGLEIELFGIDGLPSTMTGADFRGGREWETDVPSSGTVGFAARLRDREHRPVAEIAGSWNLEPESSWRLRIERMTERSGDRENRCPDPWDRCHLLWEAPIREDMRNYPSETLWATLFRVSTEYACPKGVLCM